MKEGFVFCTLMDLRSKKTYVGTVRSWDIVLSGDHNSK
jgi:hypothetical protein